MKTSMQAAGGRVCAPCDPAYPYRAVVIVCHGDIWMIDQVFEMRTDVEAEEAAEETAIALLLEPGVTNAHFYVGEVVS